MAKRNRPNMDRKQGNKTTEADLIKLVRLKAQHYLDTKGVTSVGVGYRINKETGEETDELCVQFTVEEKASIESLEGKGLERLPDSIVDDAGNKVRVQVIERSFRPDVVLLDDPPEGEHVGGNIRRRRRSRQDPIQPGISVSHKDGTAGTLGAVVYDQRTGDPYILSNWHVLQGAGGKEGDPILQPGLFDGGSQARDSVGKLVRSHLGLAGDCAVSSIDERSFVTTILETDAVPPSVIGRAELGDKVIKSGRTTGVTRGIVKRVGIVAKITYPGVGSKKIGAFEILPDPLYPASDGEISKGGDSGSVWMIAEGKNANVPVGLHFAGEIDPDPGAEHALACNIHSVMEKLDVTFDRTSIVASRGTLLRRSIDIASELRMGDSEEEQEESDLTLEDVTEIQRRLYSEPRKTLDFFRQAVDAKLTEQELNSALEDLRAALQNPQEAERVIQASHALESTAEKLPATFTFPGIDLNRYPIKPGRRKFESVADFLSWILFCGPPFLFGTKKAAFRSHNAYSSRFRYRMTEPSPEIPLEIALLSDWGTGEYQSNYISKQLEQREYPVGVHLGDVYYAGRKSEFRKYVKDPLQHVVGRTELFFLNSNHEMMRGAKWYYNFLDEKRQENPQQQRQEGSYFALESSKFQIVGIDTDYHESSRLRERELLEWLEERLVEGRKSHKTNILTSSNHPYEYGSKNLKSLLDRDLRDLIRRRLVDLWFWGNTHYCALFEKSKDTPFIGSCIGHGGYPYDREKFGKRTPAPIKFLETQARFPAQTSLRQDRGNNGYCVMKLRSDGTVGLRYVDWMSNIRAEAELGHDSDGLLQINSVKEF